MSLLFARFVCVVRGHESRIRGESGRAFLDCSRCGHRSPGWATEESRPVPLAPAAPRLLFGDAELAVSVTLPAEPLSSPYATARLATARGQDFRLLFDA